MGTVKDDETLQRYFDDELPADERAAFEARMTDDDRERLAALAEMRGLLNSALDAEAGDVDILSAIEGKLEPAKQAAGNGERKKGVRTWRDRVRGRTFLGTSAGLLVAAAAAFLFVLNPWQTQGPTNNCDVEHLEVAGSTATVLTVDDVADKSDTTIIWTTEED
jgi:anti-sigma factor RsiW